MSIDGCKHSFHELANDVLPGYMSTLREKMAHPISMSIFGIKGMGPVALQRQLELDKDPSACYVLMDEGRPIYVGISKGVITRLRDHVLGSDQFVATLAYKIAAAKYPHTVTASEAMRDTAFQLRFLECRDYLLSLDTSWVEIVNPFELYLFEAYCAMELGTGFVTGGWNTFATH